MLKKNNKIVCVVVTYNRLTLLKKCIKSLKNQTYSDFDILVVNNDSKDGTKEWLSQQENLIVINQANLGGAGGFFTGTKWGYDNGYDWMWLMDDDGIAEEKQLERLLSAAERLQSSFVNALVCNVDDREKLSFELVCEGKTIKTVKEAQQHSEIINSINPFNGSLIHRRIMENIGFIKKEMFIWGDEFDYYFRVKNAGYIMYTATDAIHFHPAGRAVYENVIPFVNRYKVMIPASSRRALKFRNLGFLHKTYYPTSARIKTILFYSLYYLLRLNIRGFLDFHKSFNRGMNNKF